MNKFSQKTHWHLLGLECMRLTGCQKVGIVEGLSPVAGVVKKVM